MRASVRQGVRAGAVLLAVGCATLWWAAVWRLVTRPGESGALEAAIAGGGWGLSLLPLHAEPRTRRTARRRRSRRVPPSGGQEDEGDGPV